MHPCRRANKEGRNLIWAPWLAFSVQWLSPEQENLKHQRRVEDRLKLGGPLLGQPEAQCDLRPKPSSLENSHGEEAMLSRSPDMWDS